MIEDHIAKNNLKIEKDCLKAEKRFGNDFNKDMFLSTNTRIIKRKSLIKSINKRLSNALKLENLEDIKNLIEELEIKCPVSGTGNWTNVRQFNLMFKTKIGASEDTSSDLYLRPETAQGIFVNFLNVQKTARMKIPLYCANWQSV